MTLLNSKQIFNKIKSTNRNSYQEIVTEQLKESFYDSPNYNQVTRIDNDGNSESLDVFILEYDSSKQIVGGKKILSYPYDTIKLEKGNYIITNFNDEASTWLISALDKTFLWNINGKITKCNQDLKWLDENDNLKSYPCVVLDKVSNYALDFFTNLITPNETIPILVQANSDTNTLKINDRFMFGNQPFKITVVNNVLTDSLILFYAILDAKGYDDGIIADSENSIFQVKINHEDFEQQIGYSGILDADILKDGKIISGDIVWESSSENIDIDNDGNFELISVGISTITAKYADNIDISDSINIEVVSSISDNFEIRIIPQIDKIYRGQTKSFTINTYNNNIVTSNTFAFTYNWVDSDFYTISNVTDNSFDIKCSREINTPLIITCTDETTLETKEITINLLGVW